MDKAVRGDWKLEPLPEKRAKLDINRIFTEGEYARIGLGVIPQEMEDKWFIFLEDDVLYFHRSWTGFCVYQVRFERYEGGYSIAEAWVSRDVSQYRESDDERDLSDLNSRLNQLLKYHPE